MANNNNSATMNKKAWKVFWDLQCPFSRANWQQLPAIRAQHGTEYEFSIHLTSLLFHPQAFTAQCAANLVANVKGPQAKLKFIHACFEHQDKYMNAAIGDARPSQVDAVFASIADQAGVLDKEDFTADVFLAKLHDWELAVKPAYSEHKEALAYGVYGTPKHVINERLLEDTESAWGPDEWAERLERLE